MTAFYRFEEGETIDLPLALDGAEIAAVESVEVRMQLATGGTIYELETIERAASGGVPAGWTATTSERLAPGEWVAQARFEIAGRIIIDPPARVLIEPSMWA